MAFFLIFVLLRHGIKTFVLACLTASSFGAQFSFGVTISIAKILPIIMATTAFRDGKSGLSFYLPFVFYVICLTLFCSMLWTIPAGVSFFYGEARWVVQLFNFLMLVLAARAIALSLTDRNMVETFWRFFTIVVTIHGIASVYQLIAINFSLPLIGISRPFGLTREDSVADIAAFGTSFGTTVVRPGGLAGEPKGMAAIYGIYIISYLFGGRWIKANWWQFNIAPLGLVVSLLGFVAAFSTSAIFGILVGIVFIALLLGIKWRLRSLTYTPMIMLGCIVLWMYLTGISSLSDLTDIFGERTTGRLIADFDPPVAGSIDAMIRYPLIGIFGFGLGGSSFLVMEYLDKVFQYAYSPNVGVIVFLVEFGIVGTALILLPLFSVNMQIARYSRRKKDIHITLLLAISLSTFFLCFTGSGVPFGYSLAVGASAAAMKMCVRNKLN